MRKPLIITTTGTKGKTTVVTMLAQAMHNLNYNVLHVTTNGHFVDGEQKSTLEDSKTIWGLKTPTLIPGRYLCEFTSTSQDDRPTAAVLEATFSCSRVGLGYDKHDIGLFLNVYDDHIDPKGSIKNRADLAKAKSFVFSELSEQGTAIFNGDDSNVCSVLDKIPHDSVRLIPCGVEFSSFELEPHLAAGGAAVTIHDGKVVILDGQKKHSVVAVGDVDWTFSGRHYPSVLNLMYVTAALYAAGPSQNIVNISAALRQTHTSIETGRMVMQQTPGGVRVIADYAHEKESLSALATLARTYVERGRLIGVVRLSHERSEETITSLSKHIAELFDELVVYDKIDGYWRKATKSSIKRYPQVEGKISQVVFEAIQTVNSNVERIVREDKAIERAAQKAKTGDVVVVIVNDNAVRSMGHIQKAFGISGAVKN